MRKQPLLIFSILFILGIVTVDYFSPAPYTVYIFSGITIFLVMLLLTRKLLFLKFKNFFICLAAFSLGMLLHHFNLPKNFSNQFQNKETVVFKLTKKLNTNAKNRRYEVVCYRGKIQFSSVLYIPKEEKELDYLHFYRAEVYLNKVAPPENDYQFNYAKYLARKNIYRQVYVPNGFEVAQSRKVGFWDMVNQKRQDVLQKIDASTMSKKSREFLKGIILADRTEMESGTVSDFSRTGLAHILAISGSHIAVIFGIVYFLLTWLVPAKFRNYAIILSLIFICIFAAFIGFGNSVVRSCIMLSVYFIYVLLQRKPDLLHAMALAALGILIWDTHQFFDVGFQLSFLAVFGIFWLNKPLQNYLPKPRNKIQRFFINVFTVTVAAQIVTLPLVLYYFHQFSFISFIANFVIVPIAEILIIASLVMTVLFGFNIQFTVLNNFFDGWVNGVLNIIHWFSGFEKVFFKNIPMNIAETLILLIAVFMLRFLILRFTSKNLLRFGYAILLFFAVRVCLNQYYLGKDETLLHKVYKDKVFSIKEKDKIYFWISEKSDRERIEKFVVDPYLTSRRTNKFEINLLPEEAESVFWKGKNYPLK